MENNKYTQVGYANMFPVAVKEGKLRKKKPNFKKLAKERTLILIIGVSENKKIRKFIDKNEDVRKITYSEIVSELEENPIPWEDLQTDANNEFYRRVKKALKKGTAVVERYFKTLDSRIGFLEVAMEKDFAQRTVLIVSKVEIEKNKELKKQLKNKTLLKGVDEVYLL